MSLDEFINCYGSDLSANKCLKIRDGLVTIVAVAKASLHYNLDCKGED
jgi:hypothetical protein